MHNCGISVKTPDNIASALASRVGEGYVHEIMKYECYFCMDEF